MSIDFASLINYYCFTFAAPPVIILCTARFCIIYSHFILLPLANKHPKITEQSKNFITVYPDAVYEIIDIDRGAFPISGTAIRNMKTDEERKKWIV